MNNCPIRSSGYIIYFPLPSNMDLGEQSMKLFINGVMCQTGHNVSMHLPLPSDAGRPNDDITLLWAFSSTDLFTDSGSNSLLPATFVGGFAGVICGEAATLGPSLAAASTYTAHMVSFFYKRDTYQGLLGHSQLVCCFSDPPVYRLIIKKSATIW